MNNEPMEFPVNRAAPDAEIIKAPARLTLDRSKAYAEAFLSRGFAEVMKDISNQVASIILLINETTLGLLEAYNNTNSAAARSELQQSLKDLIDHAGTIARNKTALLTAIGPEPTDLQVDADGHVVGTKPAVQKMLPEDFERLMGDGLSPFKDAKLSLDPNDTDNQSRTPTA